MAQAATTLGTIKGMCACYSKVTLNERPYDAIYKRLLSGEDYRFNEMMRRGGILCEFGHPAQYVSDFERTETDPEKAVALLTKIEEGEDGKVYAEGIILDTPAGRIYNAIAPHYKFGFSSRGSYEEDPDSTEGPNGWNQDSYVFKGFDIVPLPANEGSEVSATESFKGRKGKRPRFKSAREALDINQIADAASVNPDEVAAELDKIFNEEGNVAPAEMVSMRDVLSERPDIGSTSGSQSNVLLDLQKVLVDKAALEKEIQKLLFKQAESDAALISSRNQIAQLQQIQADAESQITQYTKNKAEIQQLLDKLISTHHGFVGQSDQEIANERARSQSLAAQIASLKKAAADATSEAEVLYGQAQRAEAAESAASVAKEEIVRLRKANELLLSEKKAAISATEQLEAKNTGVVDLLTKELEELKLALDKSRKLSKQHMLEAAAAKEALLDTYATLYSIDRQQLEYKVGKQATVSVIRAAAEGLSQAALRLTAYNAVPQGAVKKVAKPVNQFRPVDDIDKELWDGLEHDSRMGGE